MVRSLFALLLLATAVGCGSPSPSAPVAEGADSALSEAPRDVARTDVDKADKAKDPGKHSAGDPLGQTLALAPGDLAVVFTNNVDGEIEPCG